MIDGTAKGIVTGAADAANPTALSPTPSWTWRAIKLVHNAGLSHWVLSIPVPARQLPTHPYPADRRSGHPGTTLGQNHPDRGRGDGPQNLRADELLPCRAGICVKAGLSAALRRNQLTDASCANPMVRPGCPAGRCFSLARRNPGRK